MAIAYVASDGNDASFSPSAVTLPASIAAGAQILIFAVNIAGSVTPGVTLTYTGSTPTSLITPVDNAANFMTAGAWGVVAAGGDENAVATITAPNGANYSGVAYLIYTGVDHVDVIASGTVNSDTTFPAPSAVTGVDGDWAVWYAGVSGESSFSSSPGTERFTSSSNRSFLADSNGSVGPAGTQIGGGDWVDGYPVAWAGFTIGLAPAGSGPVNVTATLGTGAGAPSMALAGAETFAAALGTGLPGPSMAFDATETGANVTAVLGIGLPGPSMRFRQAGAGSQAYPVTLDPRGVRRLAEVQQGAPLGGCYVRDPYVT